MNKFMIFDASVTIGKEKEAEKILKQIAFSRKEKHYNTTTYRNIIIKIPHNQNNSNINHTSVIDSEIPNLSEVLSSFTVNKIIKESELGVAYFDGSMSHSGCSGVGIICDKQDEDGILDIFTGSKYLVSAYGSEIDNGTNNIGELSGVLYTIQEIKLRKKEHWVIIGDSEYSIKVYREWVHGWIKNNWTNSQNKEVMNKELISETFDILKSLDKTISFKWTPAHVGTPINELCDTTCKELTGYDG